MFTKRYEMCHILILYYDSVFFLCGVVKPVQDIFLTTVKSVMNCMTSKYDSSIRKTLVTKNSLTIQGQV